MASLLSQNHRYRSHSASPTSSSARSPDKSWQVATKRAYPHNAFSVKDASSPQKWDVDVWRRGKRRRQDKRHTPPFVLGERYKATAPPAQSLATASSDFHLFPRRDRDSKGRTRRSNHSFQSPLMELDDAEHSDLTSLSHLRSKAFWELHRSIAENGEGLVQRMRDYEHSRSDVYLRAKEAQKRGRKRSSLAASSHRLNFMHPESDGDQEGEGEEDEILIFAGELSRISQPRSPCHKKRSLSLDLMDQDTSDCESTTFTSRTCSSPGVTCDSGSSVYHSDDDQFHSSGAASPLTQSLLSPSPPHPFATSFVPRLPNTCLDSVSSSPLSPPLPFLPSSPAQSPHPDALSASRSEKAIAALSLAMANGAGAIADYKALLAIQTSQPYSEYTTSLGFIFIEGNDCGVVLSIFGCM